MKILTLIQKCCVLFLFIALVSCDGYYNNDCFSGHGPTIRENRNATGFNSLVNSINADVFVTQGENYEVIVEARESIIGKINTYVRNDELRIESNHCLRNTSINVFITTPDINAIANIGSGTVFGENLWQTNDLELSVTGSGDIRADVETNTIFNRISGSGDIRITGSTNNQEISISGSGRVNAFGLLTNTCSITISGSGRCEVNVDDNLDVKISGSGNVYYKGNPQITSSISGSGRVIDAN
ncbi:head GIN domain-containing protein [Fulvivirgaceae bacterium BMA10]|uniref:Head GIN domain-containing protein n=1 Tax=Splendidivirga corallicola TaxID=3051826 RepID=A0ABT8KQF1_9BACT|nr:head GIN domain-containing protein [Fulvivirgaceae bacterium BMA10]